ncbi:MAG: glycosyltransferase [Pseudonocardiaceae bacterium]
MKFAVAADFCPSVRLQGFEAEPAGLNWLLADTGATFRERQHMPLSRQSTWFLTEVFADAAAHAMVPDLLSICERWHPEVIVRNDFEFGSCVAAEITGIPQATFGVSPFMPASMLEPVIGDQLAYLRSTHGLTPFPALDMLYPYLYFTIAPLSFQHPVSPVIHALRTRPVEEPGPGLPDWVVSLPDRPTVYVSLGTIFNRIPDLLPTIIGALRAESVNLIVTIGRNQDADSLGDQPENVHLAQYIPQDFLLPHCDLFVTTGSFATTMAAVRYGVPLLLIPITGDDRINAQRVSTAGFGLVLSLPGPFEVGLPDTALEFDPANVRAAASQLLSCASYRANAARLREEVETLPDLEHGVDLLTRLATSGSR